jgi:hypothetical protein
MKAGVKRTIGQSAAAAVIAATQLRANLARSMALAHLVCTFINSH